MEWPAEPCALQASEHITAFQARKRAGRSPHPHSPNSESLHHPPRSKEVLLFPDCDPMPLLAEKRAEWCPVGPRRAGLRYSE
jgi:hypothetical protein